MGYVHDWATSAAERILDEDEHGRMGRERRERVIERYAAIIATFTDPLVKLLHEAHNGHHSRGYNDEGCDYPPCPKSYDDAGESAKCTCGADAWNARVKAALSARKQKA